MFQAIICGDLHFEKLYRYFPKKENADDFIFEQLDKLTNYARKLGIKYIIQLGDVFDHPQPSQKTVKNFLNYLHKNKDLNWIFILGNHDYNSLNANSMEICSFLSFNNILPNVKVFNKPEHVIIDGANLFFSPFPCFKKFGSLSNTKCVCFGHFEINGSLADNGSVITKGVDEKDLDTSDFWILGHLHRKQIKNNINYIGTPLQFSFGEPAEKFFGVLKVENSETTLTTFPLELPYKFINIRINSEEDLRNLQFKENHFYKLFISDTNIDLSPIKGKENYIYKIQYNLKDAKPNSNISEIFLEESEKEKNFNNFDGIEKYMENLNLNKEQIKVAIQIISDEKLNYKPSR